MKTRKTRKHENKKKQENKKKTRKETILKN